MRSTAQRWCVAGSFRSRPWCHRRSQSEICLHSLVEEVLPAERTRTWARARRPFSHEFHSCACHELFWPPQHAYFIRRFFQAERLGQRALALIVDDGFHFPPDAHVEELPAVPSRALSATIPHQSAGDFITPSAARMGYAANAMNGSGAVDQMKRQLLLDQLNSSWGRRCFSRLAD